MWNKSFDDYVDYYGVTIQLDQLIHESEYSAVYEAVDLKEFIKEIVKKIKELFDKCIEYIKSKFFYKRTSNPASETWRGIRVRDR